MFLNACRQPSQSKPRRDANLAGIAAAARPSAPSVRPSGRPLERPPPPPPSERAPSPARSLATQSRDQSHSAAVARPTTTDDESDDEAERSRAQTRQKYRVGPLSAPIAPRGSRPALQTSEYASKPKVRPNLRSSRRVAPSTRSPAMAASISGVSRRSIISPPGRQRQRAIARWLFLTQGLFCR